MGFRAEEQYRRRLDLPPPQYARKRPPWLAEDQTIQTLRQGSQQQMAAAQQEAQNLAAQTERTGQQRAEAIGQLGAAVGGIGEESRRNKELAMRREQLDLQREQAQQAMDIAGAQEGRAAELHPYATQEAQQRIASGNLTNEEQRLRVEIAQQQNEFMNQDASALGLPGAQEGQTVREYQLAAEASQNALGLEELKQRMKVLDMDIAQRTKTDPLQVQLLSQNLENSRSNLALTNLNRKATAMTVNQQQRDQNQANIANVLQAAASDDMQRGDMSFAAMNQKAAEFRQMGMDEVDIAAGLNCARQQIGSQKAQQAMVNMADPRYQQKIQNEMKAEKWQQVKNKMMTMAKQIGNYVGGDAERAQLQSLQQDFISLGKPHLAKHIEPFLAFDGLMPSTRSARIKEAIKMIDQEIMAGLMNPTGMGSSLGMPATMGLYQNVSSGQWGWGAQTTQGTPNLFNSLVNVDASQLGGGQ